MSQSPPPVSRRRTSIYSQHSRNSSSKETTAALRIPGAAVVGDPNHTKYQTRTSYFKRCVRAITSWDLGILSITAVAISIWGYGTFIVPNSARQQVLRAEASTANFEAHGRVVVEFSNYLSVTRSIAALCFASAWRDGLVPTGSNQSNINQTMFETFAAEELSRFPAIHSVELRPRSIVSDVFPRGNSQAQLGQNTALVQPVENAAQIVSTAGFIGGPRTFAGFPALVTYWPIFTNSTSALTSPTTQYWGSAGVVIDLNRFVQDANVTAKHPGDRGFGVHLLNEVTGAQVWLGNWSGGINTAASIEQYVATRRAVENNNVMVQRRSVNGLQVTTVFEVIVLPMASIESLSVAVGVCIALAGVALFTFLVIIRGRVIASMTKDIRLAPTEGKVTLLFTDIVGSTDKWGAHGPLMAVAIKVHHREIRSAITAHDSYEVKNLGDGFMIACQDADRAILLANQIHLRLLQAEWPKLPSAAAAKDTTPDDATAKEPAMPRSLELVVRIGVHTGDPQVVFDEVSKAPDYYGPVVNMAARLEHGAPQGRTLVSAAAMAAISETVRVDLHIREVPPITFKGIATPQQVFVVAPFHKDDDSDDDEPEAVQNVQADDDQTTPTTAACLPNLVSEA